MTIEQILNGTSNVPTDELKNRFLEKTIRSGIQSRISRIPSDYLENIERVVMSIADGTVVNGYCRQVCMGETPKPQIALSEEDKMELIKGLKQICVNQIENYKNNLDYIFGNSSKTSEPVQQPVEKKVEVEIEAKPAETNQPTYFGY